jgi:hypothetical protein
VHVGFSFIALTLGGTKAQTLFGAAIFAWSLVIDVPVALFIGVLEFMYAHMALAAVPFVDSLSLSTGQTIGAALAFSAFGTALEVSLHFAFQGLPPGPPPKMNVPPSHFPLVGLYFAILFGLQYLTWDLSMRFLGYQPQLHRRINEITNAYHAMDAEEAAQQKNEHARAFHLYAISQQPI